MAVCAGGFAQKGVASLLFLSGFEPVALVLQGFRLFSQITAMLFYYPIFAHGFRKRPGFSLCFESTLRTPFLFFYLYNKIGRAGCVQHVIGVPPPALQRCGFEACSLRPLCVQGFPGSHFVSFFINKISFKILWINLLSVFLRCLICVCHALSSNV